MEKLLPLLSGSLNEMLDCVAKKYNDPIAILLENVNSLIETYNNNSWVNETNELYKVFQLVPAEIHKYINDSVRMITARIGDVFEVSFLPEGKEPEYTDNGNWSKHNRQSGKPARIFQKLVEKKFTNYEWEQFSNRLKSEICCCNNFQLVEGEDIRKWYHEDNYYRCDGTLGNSCMRHPECQDYFDLYVDKAKMLITTKDGKLTGRAIVWELGDGITLLDRIYTCFDYLENCFIDYAKEHKWWIRENNSLLSSGDDQYWYTPEDDYQTVTSPEFEIKLDKQYEFFPYVDSFRYFDEGYNVISTHDHGWQYLDSTEGFYERPTTYECDYCGAEYTSRGDELPDGMYYSDYEDQYLCQDCAVWCEGLSDYVRPDTELVSVHCRYSTVTYPLEYVKERLHTQGNEYSAFYHFVKINDEYYDTSHASLRFNEATRMYYLNESED